jgi:guanylate kinase
MSVAGSIFVVSGPSGVGKSTLIKHVRESVSMLGYSVSHTSRKPRGVEVDGVDYHFVGRNTFADMIEKGEFVEWAEVYSDYYGTSVSGIEGPTSQGLDILMDVDAQGARNIKSRFERSVLIYILPPSMEELEKRLKTRGTEDEEAVRRRLGKALKEMKNCLWYDYLIFNDELTRAVEDVRSVISAERCRRSRQLPKAREAFGSFTADRKARGQKKEEKEITKARKEENTK